MLAISLPAAYGQNLESPAKARLQDPIMTGYSDYLTGLDGAHAARAWLDSAGALRAMLIALPRLQTINIAYGKAAGDAVLVEMAQRIVGHVREALGPEAMVARLAGGQFLVAVAGSGPRERWQAEAEIVARLLARAMTVEGDVLHIAPRIALIAAAPGEGSAVFDHLASAIATLERQPGRRVGWADADHTVPGASSALLEADLLGAMHRDEIAVLFQPQYDVASGAITGAEALARWEHPRFGLIAAETLFAVADRGDLVAQLSRHIARAALALAARWPAALGLSLNITAEDFAAGDVTRRFDSLLAETGFDPAALTLEITEQALIGDFDASAAALARLAERGVRVALDDFGTGFSNFRTLKALPLNTLKLDRSLVRDIARDPRDRAIVAAMIAMARALGLTVIAEGVETEEQRAVLAELGCDRFQGFLRSGPLSPEAFVRLVGASGDKR